jgi:protein-S-isoprenylcysteine O-methyltransferase Ste14/uncharacterized membrane protein (UPF0127 family)
LADPLQLAHTHWTRLKGLLGSGTLAPGAGLWLKPCRQVHTIGMRYAVDVVFLDDGHRVVHTIGGLAPGALSPRVGAATSVIELPAGTLARLGLAAGAEILIEGGASTSVASREDWAAAVACNVALAALYAFFATAHFAAARRTGQWATTMPIVVQETLLVILFLTRRRSTATSDRPFDWAVGIAGTFLPTFLRPTDQLGVLAGLGETVQIIGLLLAVGGLVSLGRSVAVVAANRGIKRSGLYGFVRHPMYAAYMLTYVGYSLSYPTVRNCLLTVATAATLCTRAIVEEHFLQQDTAYRAYARRVRWRFVPYVY